MIKRNLIKAVAIIAATAFLLLTSADIYIKTYGDISKYPAGENLINETDALALESAHNSSTLRIMTYNLLADSEGFEGTPAATRADAVCRIIESVSPDAVGLQEMSRKWFTCIYNNTSYKFVLPVKTGLFGTMTAIIYNPQTLFLVYSGERVFKNGDDSRLRRMVWAIFRSKETGEFFGIVNTHFNLTPQAADITDASVPLSQAQELIEFSEKLSGICGCSVIITGDFNAKETTSSTASPVYELLCTAFYDTKTQAQSITYGEEKNSKSLSVDHIFFTGEISVKNFCILSQTKFKALSDHFPIYADFNF